MARPALDEDPLMATVFANRPVPRQSATPPPDVPHLRLETTRSSSAPIPNKHIPFCPPGSAPCPQRQSPTPPPHTPPSKHSALRPFSLLRQPATFQRVFDSPEVYSIDVSTLEAALNEIASECLPEPKDVFPWLHGLHPDNDVQLAFFAARRRTHQYPQKCFSSITIVKAGGDLTRARLRGAISPDEILDLSGDDNAASFLEVDPREGFSIRNFHIQVAKMAMLSDIIVYGDASVTEEEVQDIGKKCATAQSTWRGTSNTDQSDAPTYNTFLLSSPFEEVEKTHRNLVAVDSQGLVTGCSPDFCE
ncbi:MAG: hypothetical protein Q9163_001090 [Psora crenata]